MRRQIRLRTQYQFEADNNVSVVRGDSQSFINGVIAMQEGEALGHDMIADSKTLSQSAMLSNQVDGLPSRFGHPGLSENATGKKLARGHNFRIDGDLLRFDMHMSEAARTSPAFGQDPVEYVLQVAETAPRDLGMSYVLYADLVWVLRDGSERPLSDDDIFNHADGRIRRHLPEDSAFDLPVMRPTSVHFVDIVNEGALTSDTGMLSALHLFDGRSSEYLVEMFDVVDRWRDQYNISLDALDGKIEHILNEYKSSKGATNMARSRKRQPKPKVLQELAGTLAEEVNGEVLEIEDGPIDGDVDDPVQSDPELDELGAGVNEVLSELSESASDEPVTLSQMRHLQEEVALLMGTVESLMANEKKMKELMRDMLDGMTALTRNQKRLSGEPVVTQRLTTGSTRKWDEVEEFEHPKPSATHTAPRQSAAQRSLEINARRSQKFGMVGR